MTLTIHDIFADPTSARGWIYDTKFTPLSKHPGEAIHQTVDAVEACRRAGYRLNGSSIWHKSSSLYPPCTVCAAGALMAVLYRVRCNVTAGPLFFRSSLRRQLLAVDHWRRGEWYEGLQCWPRRRIASSILITSRMMSRLNQLRPRSPIAMTGDWCDDMRRAADIMLEA